MLLMLAVSLAGCHSPPRPRHRLGALPFFGVLSLYQTDNPAKLGHHRYEGLQGDEVSRGIVYTCREGFIDLAHVRTEIDWAWYAAVRIRKGLDQHRQKITIQGMDETRYMVRIDYPEFWDELGPILEGQLSQELAIGLGLKLAYTMLTWHEIITYYGYKSTGFISESRSAFTWDDMSSHIVGLRVAARALSGYQRSMNDLTIYNQAVTEALAKEMHLIEAASPGITERAIESVKGRWWADDHPLKRQVESGLTDGVFKPWLVPHFEPCDNHKAQPTRLIHINRVLGPEKSAFYELRLNADLWEMEKIRKILGIKSDPGFLRPRTDFPMLLKAIRHEAIQTKGKNSLQP